MSSKALQVEKDKIVRGFHLRTAQIADKVLFDFVI